MNKEWYYAENKIKRGPFTAENLKGKITKDTLVWKEGMTNWVRAIDINEFELFFSVMPPPISEDNKNFSKIVDSIYYGWLILFLTLLTGILEYTENDKGKLYEFAIFLSLTAMIRVLIGLKSYLSEILNYQKANKNIIWIIASMIPISIFIIADSRMNMENKFSTETFSIIAIIAIIVFLAFILNIYHNLKLAIRLFNVNDSSITSFKIYAFLHILSFGFLLGVVFYIDENDNFAILETIITIIPLFFLVNGLKKVREKYVPQHRV